MSLPSLEFFARGVSSQLCHALALCECLEDFEFLISLIIKMENHLRDQHQSFLHALALFVPCLSSAGYSPLRTPTSPGVLSSGGEPMQLGRTRLTPMERQRSMKTKVCLQVDHLVISCPMWPKKSPPAHAGVLTRAVSLCFPASSHMILSSTLLWNYHSLPSSLLQHR